MTDKFVATIFKNKTADRQKLLDYGFVLKDGELQLQTNILNGQFALTVCVCKNGTIRTSLTDRDTGEPYTLFLVDSAEGNFVGEVRAAYSAALEDIAVRCFLPEVYHSSPAKQIIAYAEEKFGDKLEFLWKNDADTSALRRKDTKKWYAVFLKIPRRKLGVDSDEIVEIIDLRRDKRDRTSAADGKTTFPAYHMNKESWITVCLDGSLSDQQLRDLLDISYMLAVK